MLVYVEGGISRVQYILEQDQIMDVEMERVIKCKRRRRDSLYIYGQKQIFLKIGLYLGMLLIQIQLRQMYLVQHQFP